MGDIWLKTRKIQKPFEIHASLAAKSKVRVLIKLRIDPTLMQKLALQLTGPKEITYIYCEILRYNTVSLSTL